MYLGLYRKVKTESSLGGPSDGSVDDGLIDEPLADGEIIEVEVASDLPGGFCWKPAEVIDARDDGGFTVQIGGDARDVRVFGLAAEGSGWRRPSARAVAAVAAALREAKRRHAALNAQLPVRSGSAGEGVVASSATRRDGGSGSGGGGGGAGGGRRVLNSAPCPSEGCAGVGRSLGRATKPRSWFVCASCGVKWQQIPPRLVPPGGDPGPVIPSEETPVPLVEPSPTLLGSGRLVTAATMGEMTVAMNWFGLARLSSSMP